MFKYNKYWQIKLNKSKQGSIPTKKIVYFFVLEN